MCTLPSEACSSKYLSGSYQFIDLHDYSFDDSANSTSDWIWTEAVIPDSSGGVLPAWEKCHQVGTVPDCRVYARYVNSGTPTNEFEAPGVPVISTGGMAVSLGTPSSPSGSAKFDMTTGQVSWTSAVSGDSAVPLDGDRVAISGDSGTTIVGSDGSATASGQPAFPPSTTTFQPVGFWGSSPMQFNGDSWMAPFPQAVAAESAFVAPGYGWSFSSVGNDQGGAAVQRPLLMHISPVDPLGTRPSNYSVANFKGQMNTVTATLFNPSYLATPDVNQPRSRRTDEIVAKLVQDGEPLSSFVAFHQ